MNSESRRLRGIGAVVLIVGIIVVILNVIHFQATKQTMLLLVLAGIALPIIGLYMLAAGKNPFGK